MAVIVVGGTHRGVGKTALGCGLIGALREFRWTAVKVTSHEHGRSEALWEETSAGVGSDTSRYLAAGAGRALLASAPESDLSALLDALWARLEPGAHVIFESNRIVEYLEPDLCLMVQGGAEQGFDLAPHKPSFSLAARSADAMVARAEADGMALESRPVFHLANLERVSPEMLGWLRSRSFRGGMHKDQGTVVRDRRGMQFWG